MLAGSMKGQRHVPGKTDRVEVVVLGTGLGFSQSPPGLETHITSPTYLFKLAHLGPRLGFQEVI